MFIHVLSFSVVFENLEFILVFQNISSLNKDFNLFLLKPSSKRLPDTPIPYMKFLALFLDHLKV